MTLTRNDVVRIGCLAQGLRPAEVDAVMDEIIDFAEGTAQIITDPEDLS